MYLCRDRTDATLQEIGKFFDRCHSTVILCVRSVQESEDLLRVCSRIDLSGMEKTKPLVERALDLLEEISKQDCKCGKKVTAFLRDLGR